ncbi:hypothetical protein [Nannocystis pusilla]|uniref:hypothetical protein n=1 Tax=Nannocystis pusilla TaxID=889268 RepID=UPI003B7A80E6
MSRMRLEWIAIASLTACGATPTADTSAGRPATASPAAPVAASEPVVAEPTAPPVAAAVPAAPPPLPTAAEAGECPAADDRAYGILVSPQRPAVGQPMRVLAATLAGEEALALRVDGGAAPSDMRFWTGAPAAALATVTPDKPGELVIVAGRGGVGKACLKVKVRERAGRDAPPPASTAVWPSQRAWDSGEEALYSAWVRALFHAEPGVDLAYTALDQVTRDPARNILHDAYAWGEDAAPQQGGLHMRPDCADTPYFLRAYYSWKRALPFGFRGCSRGGPGKPPRCGEATSNLAAPGGSGPQPGQLGAVQHFMRRTLAWGCTPVTGGWRWATSAAIYIRCASIAARCGRARSTPIRTGTSWCWSSCSRARAGARGCCTRSTVSPTAASPASGSGRATSCGTRTRCSAARGSRTSARSRSATARRRR